MALGSKDALWLVNSLPPIFSRGDVMRLAGERYLCKWFAAPGRRAEARLEAAS